MQEVRLSFQRDEGPYGLIIVPSRYEWDLNNEYRWSHIFKNVTTQLIDLTEKAHLRLYHFSFSNDCLTLILIFKMFNYTERGSNYMFTYAGIISLFLRGY